eukprot:scaffold73127_cov102-Phaeocystis_antarctica.AAC.1
MVRERQSGRSLAFLGACGPAPRRTQARRARARVSFLIHGPHATRPLCAVASHLLPGLRCEEAR